MSRKPKQVDELFAAVLDIILNAAVVVLGREYELEAGSTAATFNRQGWISAKLMARTADEAYPSARVMFEINGTYLTVYVSDGAHERRSSFPLDTDIPVAGEAVARAYLAFVEDHT